MHKCVASYEDTSLVQLYAFGPYKLMKVMLMVLPLHMVLLWLRLRDITPTRSITHVGLAEQSIAYPVRAKTALCSLQKRGLNALP